MGEEGFLELVDLAGGMTQHEAREAARATLRTLAERITPGEGPEQPESAAFEGFRPSVGGCVDGGRVGP
jgi:hypothetical protein